MSHCHVTSSFVDRREPTFSTSVLADLSAVHKLLICIISLYCPIAYPYRTRHTCILPLPTQLASSILECVIMPIVRQHSLDHIVQCDGPIHDIIGRVNLSWGSVGLVGELGRYVHSSERHLLGYTDTEKLMARMSIMKVPWPRVGSDSLSLRADNRDEQNPV